MDKPREWRVNFSFDYDLGSQPNLTRRSLSVWPKAGSDPLLTLRGNGESLRVEFINPSGEVGKTFYGSARRVEKDCRRRIIDGIPVAPARNEKGKKLKLDSSKSHCVVSGFDAQAVEFFAKAKEFAKYRISIDGKLIGEGDLGGLLAETFATGALAKPVHALPGDVNFQDPCVTIATVMAIVKKAGQAQKYSELQITARNIRGFLDCP